MKRGAVKKDTNKQKSKEFGLWAIILTILLPGVFIFLIFLSFLSPEESNILLVVPILIILVIFGLSIVAIKKNYLRGLAITSLVLVAIYILGFYWFFFVSVESSQTTSCSNQIGYIDVSPNQEKMIFDYCLNEDKMIYLSDTSGKNIQQLIKFPIENISLGAVFYSNGSKVFFMDNVPNKVVFYSLNLNDNAKKEVISSIETNVTFFEPVPSSDGKKIYLLGSGFYGSYSPIASSKYHEFDIYSVDTETKEVIRLTNISEYALWGLRLLNGSLITNSMELDLKASKISNASYEKYSVVLPETKYLNLHPSAKTFDDNKKIIFVVDSEDSKTEGLYLFDFETGEVINKIYEDNIGLRDFEIVSNENKILFVKNNGELWQVNIDGSELKKVELQLPSD